MIPNYRSFSLLFLAFFPLFLVSCGVKPYPYEKITATEKIEAFTQQLKPISSLSSDVRIEVTYLGNGIKGKGYLYYREGKLRILLLSPVKSPLYDLLVDTRSSYLIDYQYMGFLDLKQEECVDGEMLPEKFNTVLPMLFFDFSGENMQNLRAVYRDESGRIAGFDYLTQRVHLQRLVTVQFQEYQEINGNAVPGKIVIQNAGNDIVIELTGNIVVDEPIKDKVFDLSRLNKYQDLCSEK